MILDLIATLVVIYLGLVFLNMMFVILNREVFYKIVVWRDRKKNGEPPKDLAEFFEAAEKLLMKFDYNVLDIITLKYFFDNLESVLSTFLLAIGFDFYTNFKHWVMVKDEHIHLLTNQLRGTSKIPQHKYEKRMEYLESQLHWFRNTYPTFHKIHMWWGDCPFTQLKMKIFG